jgi:hypothetical protein
MSDCKTFGKEFEAAADGGALGPRAVAHAETCAACGGELRGGEALRGLVRGLGRVEAPPDFEFRLRARMAASRPGGGGLFARLFPVSGLAWAAVAVCALSVSAAVYFRQAQPAKHGASNGGEVASIPQVQASPTANESNSAGVKATQPTDAGQPTAAGPTVASIGMAPFVKPRGTTSNRGASHARERESTARETRNDSPRGGSVDAAVSTARVKLPLFSSGANVASNVPAQGIQLGTSAGTLRVVLRDERGTLVPMRTVSFGSQEPLSRESASRSANAKDDEGVW